MITCPFCNSTRIIYVRHDNDWGGGHEVELLNPIEQYEEDDLNDDKEPSFGDIKIHACLKCDYIWQRYGSFKPPVCGPQAKEG